MTSLAVVPTETVYKFKEAARVPIGVTVEGVLDERQSIADRYGRVTVKESADAVLASPDAFPNLRAFAPADAETALRQAVQEGIRHAYGSIVEVMREEGPRGGVREVEVRVFHAVPVEGTDSLSFEAIEVIREKPQQRNFLIAQLRRDAEVFAEKVKDVLAELAALS